MSVYKQRAPLIAARETLLANGYVPLPAKGKRVLIRGWTTAEVTSEWLRANIGFTNTGLRCDGLCAIDIDCDSPGLTPVLREIIEGVTGKTPCVRVRGPRLILLFATDADSSRSTPRYRDASGRTNRVEVLRGQKRQFIALGIHPSGDPYEWPNESPLTTPRERLPRLTAEQVEQMLRAVRAHLDACDYLEQLQSDPDVGNYHPEERLTPGMKFTVVGPAGYEGVFTVEEMASDLECMGEGGALQCNLDGVRPGSDSRAGLARLVAGRIQISDFVRERVYVLPTNSDASDLLDGAEAIAPADLAQVFPSVSPHLILARRFFCEATGKGHDPDRPEVGYEIKATERAFGSDTTDDWLVRCRRAVDFTFEPGAGRWVRRVTGDYFNTYREPTHPESGGELETWDAFMAHLLPKEDERKWFEDWLAYKVQHPDRKGHGVLMVAHQVFGAGRGTLFEIIRRLFGESNTRTVDFATVTGRSGQAQYNDWMAGTLFVLVPEVKEVDPYAARNHTVKEQAYEAIKEVADPTIGKLRVKEKYGRIREETLYANVLAATNHHDAMAVPAGDRRLAVLSNGGAMEPEFAVRVHGWLRRAENIGALYRRLKAAKISYVPSGKPIETEAKRIMVLASASEVDLVVVQLRAMCPGDWVTYTRAVEFATEIAAMENMELSPGAMLYLKRVLRRDFPRRNTRVRLSGGSLEYAHHVRGPVDCDLTHVKAELEKSEKEGLRDDTG